MFRRVLFVFLIHLTWANPWARPPEINKELSEKINLSLRQVGDQLLQIAGEDQMGIPPVFQSGAQEFTLQLEHAFNYDTLPKLLDLAIKNYNLDLDYQVAIKACGKELPILGYNRQAFERGRVPCTGREQWSECNNIVFTVVETKRLEASKAKWPWLPLFLGLTGGSVLTWFWFKKNREKKLPEETPTNVLKIGTFDFDYQNQILHFGSSRQSLTFRENKLLQVLASRSNQVIKRETLVAEVWGDEGVIIGRSLDVFISRLRKLLKADESVQIKNVHGVGYRLEIS